MTELQEDVQLALLDEKFKSRSKILYDRVADTKSVTKADFEKNLQKADVILVYPKLASVSLFRKFTYFGNAGIQGISFSSSKLYMGDGIINGFGLNFKEGVNFLKNISVKQFLNNYKGIIVLRYKKITEEKADKVVEYINGKMEEGVEYSHKDTTISFFKHIFKKDDDKKLSKTFVKQFKGDLFCSNIINMAYIYAGLDTGIKDVNGLYVWPVDFLWSTKFKPVFKYFVKGVTN
jgi:hypothetical protein